MQHILRKKVTNAAGEEVSVFMAPSKTGYYEVFAGPGLEITRDFHRQYRRRTAAYEAFRALIDQLTTATPTTSR